MEKQQTEEEEEEEEEKKKKKRMEKQVSFGTDHNRINQNNNNTHPHRLEKQVSFGTDHNHINQNNNKHPHRLEKQKSFGTDHNHINHINQNNNNKHPHRLEKQKSFGTDHNHINQNNNNSKHPHRLEKHKSFGGRLEFPFPNPKKNKRGDSLFHALARSGDLTRLHHILRLQPHATTDLLSKPNLDGETPLYVASECGHSAAVALLLPLMDLPAASLRARNGYDAFHIATRLAHLDVLHLLLSAFPSLAMTTDSSNMTPLHTAVSQGHSRVVDLLLHAGHSNLSHIARNNGKTVLHSAARMGHLHILQSLLTARAPFRPDAKGQTPLHMAAKSPDPRILLHFLQHLPESDPAALLSSQDNKGNTPLHVAVHKSRLPNVRTLLSHHPSAFINSPNKAGLTPLDIALNHPLPNPELLSLLHNAGAATSSIRPIHHKHQLNQTVSDIKHDVESQLHHTRQTRFRVHKIANRLKKLHISGLNNAINSATIVAVLIATVAFAAIFQVPGQFVEDQTQGYTVGQAHIATNAAFIAFFVFDSLALFISLAVVVVQTSVVVIEQKAKRQLVFVINKLMWLACLFISVAFVALTYIVVGSHSRWLGIYSSVLGGTIMLTTVGSMCYCVVSHRIEESKLRNIRKLESRSRSFSASVPSESEMLNAEYNKRMYAL